MPIVFDPENEEPLTPNHLPLIRSNYNLPPGLFDKKDNYVRRRWAQVQYLTNQFRIRWTREFLTNIIHRQKWFQTQRNLRKDDIVPTVDESQQRSRWALVRIIDVFPGRKELVRTVLVKTRNAMMKRPASKLCPILPSDAQQ